MRKPIRKVEIGIYTNTEGKKTWSVHENGTLVAPASQDKEAQEALAAHLFVNAPPPSVLNEWDGDAGTMKELMRKTAR